MSIETIKMAKLADYWNHVANRKKFNIKICSLSIKNVPLFEDADITINSALTSICGRNGIGKTSLLKLIYGILSKDICNVGIFSSSDIDNISIDIIINGEKQTFTSSLGDGLRNVEYFDASSMALKIINEINTSPNKNGWFNTSNSYHLLNENLFFVQKITGKKYEYVKVNEVEGIIDDLTFPYFEVKEVNSNIVYTSESMGQGEHKLLIAIWKLIYTEKNSILFIEEPESFICPVSQKNFMDFLAYTIDTKKLNVLMATHSEHILSPQGLNSVLVLAKKGKKYTISNCGYNYRYFNALGLAPERKNIFLIEDDFAKLVLEYILKIKNTHLYSTCYLHNLQGESNIQKVSEHYKDSSGLNIVSVYDANQVKSRGINSDCIKNVFLPSENNLPPEAEVIECIKNNIQAYAAKLGVDADYLEGKLDAMTCDHHDFFIELSKILSDKHLSTLKGFAIALWIETNEYEIEKFLYCLENINNEFRIELKEKSENENYRYAEVANGRFKFKVDSNFNSCKCGSHLATLIHSPDAGELILKLAI
ncbi:ATP-dependent nuclease [Escherichia coli]|uniref:ATP-dependent nuclease n=1 Tax=Escherichia coli TaxID=562 RepID=UPI003EF02273